MNKKAFRSLGQCVILLLCLMASCDRFHEDLIQHQNEITINAAATEQYVLAGSPSVIDLRTLVTSSFVNATLKVSVAPTRGGLTFLSGFLWKYTPQKDFVDGSDHFTVTATDGEVTISTVDINLHMVASIATMPCTLFAVPDTIKINDGSPADIHFLENDLLCGLNGKLQTRLHSVPTSGSAEIIGDSIIRYTPDHRFHGKVEFLYEISSASNLRTTTSIGLVSVLVLDKCKLPTEIVYTLDLSDETADPVVIIPNCEAEGFEIQYMSLIASSCPDILEVAYSGTTQTNHSGQFCMDLSGKLAYIPRQDVAAVNDTARINFQFNDTPTRLVVYVKREINGGTWVVKRSNVNEMLECVFFLNDQVGFAGGTHGTILKTSDGGETWARQTTNSTLGVKSIYFANENIGYAVGYVPIPGVAPILKTTDGGLTWSELSFLPKYSLWSVYFLSPTTGFASGFIGDGSPGKLFMTINGGVSWVEKEATWGGVQYSPIVFEFKFTSATTGYGLSALNEVITTSNGGETWTTLFPMPEGITHRNVLSLAVCIDKFYAIIVDNPYQPLTTTKIYKSQDAVNWEELVSAMATYPEIMALAFSPDSKLGFAYGLGDETSDETWYPLIYRTTNSGQTWSKDETTVPAGNRLNKITVVNNQLAFGVGENGLILKYSPPK